MCVRKGRREVALSTHGRSVLNRQSSIILRLHILYYTKKNMNFGFCTPLQKFSADANDCTPNFSFALLAMTQQNFVLYLKKLVSIWSVIWEKMVFIWSVIQTFDSTNQSYNHWVSILSQNKLNYRLISYSFYWVLLHQLDINWSHHS